MIRRFPAAGYADTDATYQMDIARLLIEALQRSEDAELQRETTDEGIEIIDWTRRSPSLSPSRAPDDNDLKFAIDRGDLIIRFDLVIFI